MSDSLIRQAQIMQPAHTRIPIPEDSLSRRVCHQFRSIRREKQLTIQQVADRLGVNRDFVSKVERATSRPSIDLLDRFAKALDTELYQILIDLQTPSE